jgi:lipopolysaccharide/colanic/teichoic acid biosynthesis glycosyltransferase
VKFAWPERTYAGKRLLDISVSLILLVLSAPVMLLAALAVKLTSRGPVFYHGDRAGLASRRFEQLKFRSMSVGRTGGHFTTRDDPRLTNIGIILRLLKLDELPQLINVIRGEMSMVGPRPEVYSVVNQCYNREQLRVLSVRPGLTCTLQVRIFPDFTYEVPGGVDPEHYYRHVILPSRLQEDLDYVDRMSFALDVRLILQTAYCIFVKSWFVLWRRRLAARAAKPASCKPYSG